MQTVTAPFQASKQKLIHQQRFNLASDYTLNLPGAVFLADAFFLQKSLRRISDGKCHLLSFQHKGQFPQLFIHN